MIPSKPYIGNEAPGSIPAINIETGVKMRVRQSMIDHDPAMWRVITEAEMVHGSMPELKPIEKPTVDTTGIEEKVSGDPNVIMTKAGKPYKTETAARNAFNTKGLSDMEWMIVPVADGGFIISKV